MKARTNAQTTAGTNALATIDAVTRALDILGAAERMRADDENYVQPALNGRTAVRHGETSVALDTLYSDVRDRLLDAVRSADAARSAKVVQLRRVV